MRKNLNIKINDKINNENIHNPIGMHGMQKKQVDKLNEIRPNLQIINKKIDPDKLNCKYYNRIRREIKNQINNEADILLINLDSNKPITEKYKVESLLHLQIEFTDIVIKPKSTIEDQEFNDWINFFKPKAIMSSI